MKRITSIILVLALALSMFCTIQFRAFADDDGELPPAPTAPPSTQPSTTPTQPSTTPTQPSTTPTQPSTSPTQPSTAPTQPSTTPTQPSTEPTQPSSTPTQPSTEPTQPSIPTQPSTEPTQPSIPTQPSTEPTQPSSDPTDPSTNPPEPSTDPAAPSTLPSTPDTPAPGPGTGTAGLPVVTKSPTNETVMEGGFAEFVARATGVQKIIWHMLSPTGSSDILAEDAPKRFPGLVVTGLNTERLGLDKIPNEMNEWRIRAEFVGRSGSSWSTTAILNVINQDLVAPSITGQPESANLNANEITTLRVSAVSAENNTSLTYQWYRNTTDSNIGGKAILGATSDTFVPDYIAGTTYYYCAVRCSTGTEISAASKTLCAAVTYAEATGDIRPVTVVTTPDGETTGETQPESFDPAPKKSNTLLVIVVAAVAAIAVLGALAAVLILKFYPRDNGDDTPNYYTADDGDESDFFGAAPAAGASGRTASLDDEDGDDDDWSDLSFLMDDDK